MRRVMMLALLALALPTAALASSVSFSASSKSFLNDLFPGDEETFARVVGSPYTISLFGGGAIFGCPVICDSFTFTGGYITVTNTSTGATVFQSSVIDGEGERFMSVFGRLENGSFGFFFSIHPVDDTAFVGATVPEPSAFEGLLLGTGMLGLAEMKRRKLRRRA